MYVLKYTMSYNISRNIISPLKLGSLTEKHKEQTFQRSINFTNLINLALHSSYLPINLVICGSCGTASIGRSTVHM